MILEESKFHKNFKLNNISFSSVDELLTFSSNLHNNIYCFLKEWFSDKDCITVNTSGSTGKPKPILLQKQQMINSAFATGAFFDVGGSTKALLCLSVDYIAGKMMLVRALTLGWHLDVIKASSYPLQKITGQYDFSAMVPLQVENSLDQLSNIKKLIVGGGVVSNQLYNKLQTLKTQVFATYGMTETITHIAVKQLNLLSLKPNFYKVLPNIEIFIDHRNCLVINAPKLSNKLVVTNDVVNLISDDAFEWIGRYDNVINSGGIKLHPEKIEKELSKIIKKRFFVSSLDDEKLGQKLILIIEGVEEKISFNNLTLSKYETPKQIYYINHFVETETKKIQRKKTLDLIVDL